MIKKKKTFDSNFWVDRNRVKPNETVNIIFPASLFYSATSAYANGA